MKHQSAVTVVLFPFLYLYSFVRFAFKVTDFSSINNIICEFTNLYLIRFLFYFFEKILYLIPQSTSCKVRFPRFCSVLKTSAFPEIRCTGSRLLSKAHIQISVYIYLCLPVKPTSTEIDAPPLDHQFPACGSARAWQLIATYMACVWCAWRSRDDLCLNVSRSCYLYNRGI